MTPKFWQAAGHMAEQADRKVSIQHHNRGWYTITASLNIGGVWKSFAAASASNQRQARKIARAWVEKAELRGMHMQTSVFNGWDNPAKLDLRLRLSTFPWLKDWWQLNNHS
jgi:hypothetical protein